MYGLCPYSGKSLSSASGVSGSAAIHSLGPERRVVVVPPYDVELVEIAGAHDAQLGLQQPESFARELRAGLRPGSPLRGRAVEQGRPADARPDRGEQRQPFALAVLRTIDPAHELEVFSDEQRPQQRRRDHARLPYFCAKKGSIARSRPSTSAIAGTEMRQSCTLSFFCAAFTAAERAPCVDSSGLIT